MTDSRRAVEIEDAAKFLRNASSALLTSPGHKGVASGVAVGCKMVLDALALPTDPAPSMLEAMRGAYPYPDDNSAGHHARGLAACAQVAHGWVEGMREACAKQADARARSHESSAQDAQEGTDRWHTRKASAGMWWGFAKTLRGTRIRALPIPAPGQGEQGQGESVAQGQEAVAGNPDHASAGEGDSGVDSQRTPVAAQSLGADSPDQPQPEGESLHQCTVMWQGGFRTTEQLSDACRRELGDKPEGEVGRELICPWCFSVDPAVRNSVPAPDVFVEAGDDRRSLCWHKIHSTAAEARRGGGSK